MAQEKRFRLQGETQIRPGCRLNDSETSDDDFMTPPSKKRVIIPLAAKNHSPKRVKVVKNESINVRNPPKLLLDVMKVFNTAQTKSVRNMGFGAILCLRIEKLPTKLAHWIVKNYDPENNIIKVGKYSLMVTREAVQVVYGIPMGGIQITSLKKASTEHQVIQEFQAKFPPRLRRLRIKHVLDKMLEDVDGGRAFQINFLVAFVTIMIGGIKCGTVNQLFLPNIGQNMDIRNFDWCGYTINHLKEARRSWNPLDKQGFFTGPIIFLMVLYVASTKVRGQDVERSVPLTCAWTTKLLKERQQVEIKQGGFGKVEVEDGSHFVVNDDDNDVLINKVKRVIKNRKQGGIHHQVKQHIDKDYVEYGWGGYDQLDDFCTQEYNEIFESTQNTNMGDREEGRKADEAVSVQDYAHMVERRLALIRLTKAKLDDWLSRGRSKYMDDECLVNLEKERDILFGVELKETCKEARMSADQDLMKCTNREHILPDSVDDASLTDLEAQLPDNLTVTQILDQVETFDIVMNTALKNAGYVATSSGYFRNKNHGSQLGSFSNESELMQPNTMVGSETTNMKNAEVNEHRSNTEKTPEATIGFPRIRDPVGDVTSMPIVYPKSLNEHQLSRMAVEREKRDQKLPSVMRSPWFDRVVKVNKEVSIIEKRVFSWLSTHDGDENEVIFETTKGIQGWKGVMETLTFGSMVHANVIDIWAYILNDLERRRDPNGPARAFFKTGMLTNTMLDKSRTFPEIYDQFHGNLKDCIVRYNIGDLKNIDLVFFPLINGQHFWCVVFNLLSGQVTIINNIKDEKATALIYGPDTIKNLINYFSSYLQKVGHPIAKTTRRANSKRLEMKWQTSENSIDCGVFLMRHMEIYKGLEKWDTGLKKEKDKQQPQLDDLRKKYATKILFSEDNLHRKNIEERVRKYDKLSFEEKLYLQRKGEANRKERLDRFG